ncbi:MAG: hypothetical protein KC421_20580, partial [Anaerolineales bacterium]|nr:hypothetical protein [Anaerolineales bacterium]
FDYQDGILFVTAYRIVETSKRQDLLNDPELRLEEMKTCGGKHGNLVKLENGEYRLLVGPPVSFSDVNEKESEHAAANAFFKNVNARPNDRLVFGVHTSNGRIRDSHTLDRVAAGQMALF